MFFDFGNLKLDFFSRSSQTDMDLFWPNGPECYEMIDIQKKSYKIKNLWGKIFFCDYRLILNILLHPGYTNFITSSPGLYKLASFNSYIAFVQRIIVKKCNRPDIQFGKMSAYQKAVLDKTKDDVFRTNGPFAQNLTI